MKAHKPELQNELQLLRELEAVEKYHGVQLVRKKGDEYFDFSSGEPIPTEEIERLEKYCEYLIIIRSVAPGDVK